MNSQDRLTALPLDLHLYIFSNLQPYDILQVGQTCQSLYRASLERTVWMDALHRICVENTLFEPSFPVAKMSIQELQRASMGPRRWIARSSSKERNSDGVLPHVVTRHPMSAMSDLDIKGHHLEQIHYLVPGGRYLFSIFWEWLILWDLGSPFYSGREPHVIAAVPINRFGCEYRVHSTRDGMGLTIFLLCTDYLHQNTDMFASLYVYEIYPESTSPQFTQIAYMHIPYSDCDTFCSLSYDHLIFTHLNVLTVWDYRANTWARWSVEDECNEIIITKSAVVLIRTYGVSVWEIPPLLPESSLSMSTDPPIMSAVFDLHYPGGYQYPHIRRYPYIHQAPCDWYPGTPQPLYFDLEEAERPDTVAGTPRMIHRYEVVINSETSNGTLNLLKIFKVPSTGDCSFIRNARICQNKTVSLCTDSNSRLLRTHVTDVYSRQLRSFLTPLCNWNEATAHRDDMSFCPATCRVVYREIDGESSTIKILDF